MQLLSCLFFKLCLSTLAARVVVDDSNSTWTYSGPWNIITATNPCPACDSQPDPSKVYNRSWHDTSGIATAQLAFDGISIEVYTICPPRLSDGNYYGTNFSFTLDNVDDGIFQGPQPACSEYVYNYLAYARTNLTRGAHVFRIANTELTINTILLDYAIYDDGTIPSPSPSSLSYPTSSSHSSVPTATIVGTTIAAGLLLLANIAQFVWYRKSRKTKFQDGNSRHDSAFPVESNPPLSPMQQRTLLLASPNAEPPQSSFALESRQPAVQPQNYFRVGHTRARLKVPQRVVPVPMSVPRVSEQSSGLPRDAWHSSATGLDVVPSPVPPAAPASGTWAPDTTTVGQVDAPPTYKAQWP